MANRSAFREWYDKQMGGPENWERLERERHSVSLRISERLFGIVESFAAHLGVTPTRLATDMVDAGMWELISMLPRSERQKLKRGRYSREVLAEILENTVARPVASSRKAKDSDAGASAVGQLPSSPTMGVIE